MLACHGERGFELSLPTGAKASTRPLPSSVFEETLNRLALIGDHTVVPTSMRKKASHCGGIPPKYGVLPPFKDTPFVADPSNAVYAKVVRRLLGMHDTAAATALQRSRVQHIQCFNDEHLGDLVEAALAAADMARAFENKTIR